jgi:hypothetical protein
MREPERLQADGESEARLGIAIGHGSREGFPQVPLFLREHLHRRRAIGANQAGTLLLRDMETPAHVALLKLWASAEPSQLCRGELPDRLEHGESSRAGLVDDERLLAQGLESDDQGLLAYLLLAADRRGRGHGPTVTERGQLDEEISLRWRQEIEAPLDHGGQRAMPCRRRPAPTAEELEPSGQSIAQLTDSEVLQGRGRQLDGERKAVEASDDLGDLPDGHAVPFELGSRLHGSIEEELHRVALDRGMQRMERRQGHGPERLSALAVDVERFTTRREDPDVRAQTQELLDERRDGLHQVLAVVEDQESVLGAKRVGQRDQRRAPWGVTPSAAAIAWGR